MSNLGNKEIMAKNIRYYMEKRGLNAKEFTAELDFKYSTVLDWLNAKTYPRIDKIELMANYFNIEKSDLVESKSLDSILDTKIQNTIKQLSEPNKQKTYNYASNLLENQNNEIHELTQVYVIEKVAAGVGYSYGENEGTFYYTDRTDLPSYDFATLVSGDSMIPDYEDGDVILLRQGYDSVDGDIYVIDYDNKSYVKKLYNDGTRFVLRSLNSNYKDIIIFKSDIENTYFNIVGKVIDSFKPVKK